MRLKLLLKTTCSSFSSFRTTKNKRFNRVEAELAVAVFERIQKHLNLDEWSDVAIITP